MESLVSRGHPGVATVLVWSGGIVSRAAPHALHWVGDQTVIHDGLLVSAEAVSVVGNEGVVMVVSPVGDVLPLGALLHTLLGRVALGSGPLHPLADGRRVVEAASETRLWSNKVDSIVVRHGPTVLLGISRASNVTLLDPSVRVPSQRAVGAVAVRTLPDTSNEVALGPAGGDALLGGVRLPRPQELLHVLNISRLYDVHNRKASQEQVRQSRVLGTKILMCVPLAFGPSELFKGVIGGVVSPSFLGPIDVPPGAVDSAHALGVHREGPVPALGDVVGLGRAAGDAEACM